MLTEMAHVVLMYATLLACYEFHRTTVGRCKRTRERLVCGSAAGV